MTPMDTQSSRSNVKVKGHVGIKEIVQWITLEQFAPEASNWLVDSPWLVENPYWYTQE